MLSPCTPKLGTSGTTFAGRWRYNGSFEGNIGYSRIEIGSGDEVKQHELCDRTQPPNLKHLVLGTPPRISFAVGSVPSAISSFYQGVSDLLFPLHVAESLSLAEVSERTGIHRDTLRKKCKAGLVPGAFQVADGAWRLKRRVFEQWWASLGEETRVRRRR